jgi:hypothetical protein
MNNGWLPIRVAPKDGTQILLAEPGSRGWVIYMGAWIEAKILLEGHGLATWPSGWSAACIVTGDRGPFEEKQSRYYWRPKQAIVIPSHWMPIPDPPKTPQGRALRSAMENRHKIAGR